MKCLTRTAVVFTWLVLTATHAAAQLPEPQADRPAGVSGELQSQISRAIRQLGSNKYETRQAAQAELIQIGSLARDAITAATSDPDAEIRSRCRMILRAIEEIGRRKARAALEAKLTLLVGDSWGDHRFDLPLWKSYQKLAGTSPAAREIFAAMQRADMELLQMVATDPKEAAAIVERRFQRIQIERRLLARQKLPLGEIAALLVATADPGVIKSSDDATIVKSISSAVGLSELSNGLVDKQKGPVLRRILGGWIGRDDQDDGNTRQTKMWMALRYNVKEGLDVALDILRNPAAQTKSYTFLYGILTVGRFGDKQHLKQLEPLLTNKTKLYSVRRNKVAREIQTRDAALVAMIHITGQDLKAYGLSRVRKSTSTLYSINTLGFSADEAKARDEAIRKWRRWSAGQPRGK